MKHKSYLLFVFWLAAWLGIIFLFSAQPWPNSFHTSSAVEQKLSVLPHSLPVVRQWQSQLLKLFPLRKIAHFTEYMIWVVSVQQDIGIINGKKENRAQQCTSSDGILCPAGSTG